MQLGGEPSSRGQYTPYMDDHYVALCLEQVEYIDKSGKQRIEVDQLVRFIILEDLVSHKKKAYIKF